MRAGETISFHVSSSEPYRFSILRLGLDADSMDGETFHEDPSEHPARPLPIHPGSYIHVEKALPAEDPVRALSLECWVRPWRVDRAAGLIAQSESGRPGGMGLLALSGGRVGFLLGPRGSSGDDAILVTAEKAIEVGRWSHVGAVWDGAEKRIHVDGRCVARRATPAAALTGGSVLRVGALGEDGVASGFLDGDIASPAIHGRALDDAEMARRFEERGLVPIRGDRLLAYWPLDEERGGAVRDASGQERRGVIVNHGTWMVGGPSYHGGAPRFGAYDPARDERRGHGLRLASDDLYDCRWEAAHQWTAPRDARPGFHVALARYTMGGRSFVYPITFIVRARSDAPKAPILLLASTNTWRAYGATPFAAAAADARLLVGTDGMANGPGDPPAFSFYRRHAAGQGTYQVGLRMPCVAAGPLVHYGDRTAYSHLARAERFTQIWLERNGYEYDMACDLDLHREPDLPGRHRVVIVNGHSEYWSVPMYENMLRHLESGGNMVVLSGNTLFWRVSFDEESGVLECRKADAPGDQVPLEKRGECWHSQDGLRGGLLAECGYPGWNLCGLTTLGWIDPGNASHFTPFTVEAPEHFLFREPVPVGAGRGDPIGEACDGGFPRANGHEVDVRVSTLKRILEAAPPPGAAHPDDPPGIVLLAAGRGWPRGTATFDYWVRSVRPQVPLGGEIIYWERPGGGRVFNVGAIGAGWTLAADGKLAALVANALHHFGVPRPRA